MAVSGCGESDGRAQRTEEGPAHSFAVDHIPTQYGSEVVGRGTDEQTWDLEMGADVAYTVLEIDGRTVVASVVPWDSMESTLEWATGSNAAEPESFALDDGRQAAYGDGADGAWDGLVIEINSDDALRITSPEATRDELVDVSQHISDEVDRGRAPIVQDPPEGWSVLGSVGVDTAIALRARTIPRTNQVPGPTSAYAMGWEDTRIPVLDSSSGTLAVMVLPRGSADLDALAADTRGVWATSRPPARIEVNGRPAVVQEGGSVDGITTRWLVTNDETGAVVVVTASGEDLLGEAEMVAIAGSVRPVDDAEWTQRQVAAFGGPALAPDDGEHEIVSGEVDGVEWLVQTASQWLPAGADGVVPTQMDPCLKVSTGMWACATSSMGGGGGAVYAWTSGSQRFEQVGLPEFVVVSTPRADAARFRVSVGAVVAEADLHPIPGGDAESARAGVVFADLPESGMFSTCNPDPPSVPDGLDITVARVDLLDAAGNTVGCAGF